LVLVDAGTSNVFAPTLGRLPQSLAAAGVDPDTVDIVILTHMHPDHVPGLLSTDKKVLFKNAIVHVNSDEYAYWMSDEVRARAPDEFKPFFDLARARDQALCGRSQSSDVQGVISASSSV
jgi:glyoxylase-like metal-dependent hydrolase (beta-lactamase superfamily II)